MSTEPNSIEMSHLDVSDGGNGVTYADFLGVISVAGATGRFGGRVDTKDKMRISLFPECGGGRLLFNVTEDGVRQRVCSDCDEVPTWGGVPIEDRYWTTITEVDQTPLFMPFAYGVETNKPNTEQALAAFTEFITKIVEWARALEHKPTAGVPYDRAAPREEFALPDFLNEALGRADDGFDEDELDGIFGR